jgi:large subunit ribosomal protein L20
LLVLIFHSVCLCLPLPAKNCYRLAYRRVEKALQHSYIGRKQKKREHRSTWIQRINAGVRQYDMSYGNFIHGLNQTGIQLNRKMLSQLAIFEPFSFKAIVGTVRAEAKIPVKTYNTYGLLQSSVAVNFKPSSKKQLPAWNQTPILSNLGWQAKEDQQRTQ